MLTSQQQQQQQQHWWQQMVKAELCEQCKGTCSVMSCAWFRAGAAEASHQARQQRWTAHGRV
jgi:hypothetical protein